MIAEIYILHPSFQTAALCMLSTLSALSHQETPSPTLRATLPPISAFSKMPVYLPSLNDPLQRKEEEKT